MLFPMAFQLDGTLAVDISTRRRVREIAWSAVPSSNLSNLSISDANTLSLATHAENIGTASQVNWP